MKKLVFATPLDLGKEIIANLSDEQLQQIEGGTTGTAPSCTNTAGSSCILEEPKQPQ